MRNLWVFKIVWLLHLFFAQMQPSKWIHVTSLLIRRTVSKQRYHMSSLALCSPTLPMHAPIYAFLVQEGETSILLSLEKAGNHHYDWGITKARCHQRQLRKCKKVFLLPSLYPVKAQVEMRDIT